MKSLIRGVLAGFVLVASVSSVSADPLQFNHVGPGGDLSFDQAGTATITDAAISSVLDFDASAGPLLIKGTCGVLGLSGCLDLETGDFISFVATPSGIR